MTYIPMQWKYADGVEHDSHVKYWKYNQRGAMIPLSDRSMLFNINHFRMQRLAFTPKQAKSFNIWQALLGAGVAVSSKR